MRLTLLVALGLLSPATPPAPAAGRLPAPVPPYRVGVVSESADLVTWFTPGVRGLVREREVRVGINPMDLDGPHNLAIAPDGKSYYVSLAHGTPYGTVWRLDMATDSVLGRATVEYFPTTISLTPDGDFAFVANSDFHGDRPRQNVVSILYTPTMTKLAELPVCDMPHGVRVNRAGTSAWVSCMHSDELVEIGIPSFAVTRRVRTGAGQVGGGHDAHDAAHGTGPASCAPTYVAVAPDDRTLYVACNASGTLQVWDARTLVKTREIAVGAGAYNVDVAPGGRTVLVTNKKDQSVSIVDAASLAETARVTTSKRIVHGVAFAPDGRTAYISCESVGADPGAVDEIDLVSRRLVASVPVRGQPAGIAVWRP